MANRTCSIDDCDRPVRARGWCSKHYQRWGRHGDPTFTTLHQYPYECSVEGCAAPSKVAGMCPSHDYRRGRYGDPMAGGPRRSGTPSERFEARVLRGAPGGCWGWGTSEFRGYGKLRVDGRDVLAHRFSYEMHVGPIPEGLLIDHICWNPPCTNPEHLRLATQSENQQNRTGLDAKNKSGYRGVSWSNTYQRWEVIATVNGQRHYGGMYHDLEEAAEAARNLRLQIHPRSDMDRKPREKGSTL